MQTHVIQTKQNKAKRWWRPRTDIIG